MKHNFILLITAFILLILGCDSKESIRISGSTTVLPIISRAAEAFIESENNINIIVNAGGSGVGINQLGEGKVNIGMISRDLKKEEIESYAGVQFNTISIGKDAVVPVVSSEIYNSGLTTLTLDQIAQIYKGQIENWKELGGPDKEILCIDKEQSRGTRHVFMNIVMGDKEAVAPGADLVMGSNNEEQTAIVQSDAAIGMLSNAWLSDDVKGLNIQLTNGKVISPTLESISKGEFPITRDLQIVTNGSPKKNIKSFIDFILSPEGQDIVEKSGYVRIK